MKLQAPCEKMGDELAMTTTVFHYWTATILGWSWAIVGLLYFVNQAIVGTFNFMHFAIFWGVCVIYAMIASFMTLTVYVYKQVIAVVRQNAKLKHLVADEVEEIQVYRQEVVV